MSEPTLGPKIDFWASKQYQNPAFAAIAIDQNRNHVRVGLGSKGDLKAINVAGLSISKSNYVRDSKNMSLDRTVTPTHSSVKCLENPAVTQSLAVDK